MHSSFSTGQTEQMKRYSEFILQADGWEKSMLQHIRSGFPGGSEVKVSAWNAGDPGSIPGSGKIPWRRKWQPTPVLLPGESQGWQSLLGCRLWGHTELDTTEAT